MSSAIIFPAQPEQILKGLSKLWTSLGQEEKQQGKPTVLRACAMTLIIATDEADKGFSVLQTISELMHEHPARGIVLAVSVEAERSLQARVLAQCWKPFGKAQQICCEQIEITAQPASWPNVGPTLMGLTAADLPVIFFCRYKGALRKNATADQKAGLDAVASLATKVIVDTSGIEAHEAIEVVARLRERGQVVADLEWTRLTAWREPIAHIFDNTARDNKLSNFRSIEIEHAADGARAALYMAGWLSAPYRASVTLRKLDDAGAGIQSIRLRSESETIQFDRDSKDCGTLRSTNGRARKYSLPEPTTTALLTEELSLTGTDPAFNVAFTRVRELLRA
jgi:glucose-6-phosphate dehydrogenase assembly protein OpcA